MKIFFTGKYWRVMKFCAAQGLIAALICGVSLAHDNYGQVLDREVTMDIKEASFESAMGTIASATNTFFSYSRDLVSINEKITLKVEQKPLGEALNMLLVPHRITYAVHTDNFTIFLKKEKRMGQLDLSPSDASDYNEDKRQLVTGKIKDSNDQPMIGVNVIVKGTTTGTTSDATGDYTISAEEDDIIIFSFIGFTTVEQRVGNQTVIDITLIENVKSLNEVVINAGYWQVKEKEQTGNIAKVDSRIIEKQPVGNPLATLHGRMPGVYVQQSSGVPGSSFSIQIRGRNSLRADGNNPLYLIDGVPYNPGTLGSLFSNSIVNGGSPLNNLNPSDIESIEVLKDADATAIYGSRGANGVVLITTKKGKEGKTRLDLNIYTGAGQVSNRMNLLSTPQYVTMRKEALTNDGLESDLSNARDLLLWDTTRNTDWQKKLIGGTANITNATASVSGGNHQTKFLFGGGYYRESTVFPGNFNDQKASSHLSVSHQSLDNKFKIDAGASFVGPIPER